MPRIADIEEISKLNNLVFFSDMDNNLVNHLPKQTTANNRDGRDHVDVPDRHFRGFCLVVDLFRSC